MRHLCQDDYAWCQSSRVRQWLHSLAAHKQCRPGTASCGCHATDKLSVDKARNAFYEDSCVVVCCTCRLIRGSAGWPTPSQLHCCCTAQLQLLAPKQLICADTLRLCHWLWKEHQHNSMLRSGCTRCMYGYNHEYGPTTCNKHNTTQCNTPASRSASRIVQAAHASCT